MRYSTCFAFRTRSARSSCLFSVSKKPKEKEGKEGRGNAKQVSLNQRPERHLSQPSLCLSASDKKALKEEKKKREEGKRK